MAILEKELGRAYISPTIEVIQLYSGLSMLNERSFFTLRDEEPDWLVDELEDYGEL